MLHIVNKSPFEKNSLETCLRLSSAGSSILLIEDGVYGALAGGEMAGTIRDALADRTVCVLGPDLLARGIDPGRLIDGVEIVDYAAFVKLAVEQPKVQSWL